jgi:hypothetical protein
MKQTIMSAEDSISKTVAVAVPKLVGILTPLSTEGRQRAIASAMMIFGEATPLKTSKEEEKKDPKNDPASSDGISAKAVIWMKKNAITQEELEHVFAIDKDSIDVIAAKMPEKTNSKQTKQAYVICGVAIFLRSGEMGFSDADARALCDKVGCYDSNNHHTYIKKFGNLISGSKATGWKITNPGLTEGAKLIKQLTSEAST